MRILMLCSSYPRFEQDSASIFLRHLALALAKKDLSVYVLSPDHHLVSQSAFDPAVHLLRFRYFPRMHQSLAYGSGILPNLRQHPWRWFQVPFFLVSMFFSTYKHCRSIRPNIIHAHWVIPQGLIAVLVGKLLSIPVITTAHGGDVFALRGGLLTKLKQFTLRRSDAWTANTATTAGTIGEPRSEGRQFIVPMGVDIGEFHGRRDTAAAQLRQKFSGNIVVFVGRLVEKKGVDDLLKAFARLSDARKKDTWLWIVGDGAERKRLEQLAQALNITAFTTFHGRVPHDQLPSYYAAADLFIAPSVIDSSGDTEGQGVVIIEAMASGLAVVAYETGGIKDVVVNNETGILVPTRNIQLLAQAMDNLLNDKSLRLRLGKAGRSRTEQLFTWDSIARQFHDIYQRFDKAIQDRNSRTMS